MNIFYNIHKMKMSCIVLFVENGIKYFYLMQVKIRPWTYWANRLRSRAKIENTGMMEYRRRGRLYSIERGGVERRPGADKSVLTFHVKSGEENFSIDLYVHFPHSIIYRTNLPESVLEEVSLRKIQDWLDHGMSGSQNIYIVPEDIPAGA